MPPFWLKYIIEISLIFRLRQIVPIFVKFTEKKRGTDSVTVLFLQFKANSSSILAINLHAMPAIISRPHFKEPLNSLSRTSVKNFAEWMDTAGFLAHCSFLTSFCFVHCLISY